MRRKRKRWKKPANAKPFAFQASPKMIFGYFQMSHLCLCILNISKIENLNFANQSLDPLTLNPEKALNAIGNNLQQQYERWQARVSTSS